MLSEVFSSKFVIGLAVVFGCFIDATEWNSGAIPANSFIPLNTESPQEITYSTSFPFPDEDFNDDVKSNKSDVLESPAPTIPEELATTEFESTPFPSTEPPHVCEEDRICVRKCCPLGKLMDLGKGCPNVTLYNATDWEPNFSPPEKDKLEIVTQTLKTYEDLVCGVYKAREFVLREDGKVHHFERGKTLSYDHYCIDNKVEKGKVVQFGALCMEDVVKSTFNKVSDHIHMGLLGVSAFFIFLILVLHGLSRTKKELQTKLVISSCISLLFGFILVIVNLSPFVIDIKEDHCVALAISIQFFLLSFLFWLNIMCYEISRIIRGTMSLKSYQELTKSERRFFYYGAFAWGIPMIVCIITICMQYLPKELPSAIEPYVIRPHIAEGRCWFIERGYSIYVYYYGIEVSLHVANAFLMGHTAYLLYKETWAKLFCIWRKHPASRLRSHASTNHLKIQSEFRIIQRSSLASDWLRKFGGNESLATSIIKFKQQLRIYILYLFIWMLNAVTLIYPHKEHWRLIDFIVALQGLFLFCIVVNPKKHQILLSAYEKVSSTAKSYSLKMRVRKLAVDPISVISTRHDLESPL